MGKLFFLIIWTLICLLIGLLPELTMWFLWGVIDPVTEMGRIITIGVFILGGGGLSIFMAFLAFVIWAHGVNEIL